MTAKMGYTLFFPSKYGGVKFRLNQPQCVYIWYDDNDCRLLIFLFLPHKYGDNTSHTKWDSQTESYIAS